MSHVKTTRRKAFTILLCGKKELMARVRLLIPPSDQVHLQFASTPAFLVGRALFNPPDLVLLDVRADTLILRSAMKEFVEHNENAPVVAIADDPDHIVAVDLVKLGVSGYYVFPDDQRKIGEQITLLYNEWSALQKKEELLRHQQEVYDFRHIIGRSPALSLTLERVQKVIKNDAMTVLITGETGTGKELFARAVHYNGKRKNQPFVDIACTALPESLLESELFGYEKGAFTDAKERKVGLFELAGEGSIFLDEIGDISLATQSKLLKVIESRTLRRLGGIRDIPVRARIIAATSADLAGKMKSGMFRRDLFHRLKILPLELPPLRERMEDIPALVNEFLKTFNGTYGKRIKGITRPALQLLMEQSWEGNVRELKHAIERAVLLQEGEWITEKDFEFSASGNATNYPEPSPPGRGTSSKLVDSLMLLVPLSHASIEEVQGMLAHRVLEHVGRNKVKAARILGISRPRLDRILRKHDTSRDD